MRDGEEPLGPIRSGDRADASGTARALLLWLGSAGRRALPLALFWWALTGGTHDAWRFGGPVILLASAASVWLQPYRRIRIRTRELPRFLSFFVWQSLRAGVDVAFRALRPSRPLAPAVLEHPLSLPEGPARVLLADTVSLLPGTLTAALEADRLIVHVLDARLPMRESLCHVEERVAALFPSEL